LSILRRCCEFKTVLKLQYFQIGALSFKGIKNYCTYKFKKSNQIMNRFLEVQVYRVSNDLEHFKNARHRKKLKTDVNMTK